MKPLMPMNTEPPRVQLPPPPIAQQNLGCELKHMFDTLTAGPLPDRLVQLAAAVDEALRRGELFEDRPRRIS